MRQILRFLFIVFSSNCIVIVSSMVITRKRSLARVYKHIYIYILYIPGRVFFSSPDRVSYCHHWAFVVCRPSVNFSHFNLLLWSHWANLNQTLVEWSLDGPFPKLCPVIPTSNQDGHQAKNRKRRDEILIVHCCFSISQNELQLHGKK